MRWTMCCYIISVGHTNQLRRAVLPSFVPSLVCYVGTWRREEVIQRIINYKTLMEEKEREKEEVGPPVVADESIKKETSIDVVEEEEENTVPKNNINKKRKLLPADSLVENNIKKHQLQFSNYGDESIGSKNNNNYGMQHGKLYQIQPQPIISQLEQKRQKYKILQQRRRYVIQELNLPKKINYWSIEDVADWIGYIGFSNYQETMFENNINGEVLGSLTKDDLRDMNIRAIGDRILILNAIETLKRSHNTTNVGKCNKNDNDNPRKNAQYLQYLKRKGTGEDQGKLYVYQQEEEIQRQQQQYLQLQQGDSPLPRHNVPDLNFSKVTDHRNNNGATLDSARSSVSSA